MRKIVSAVFVLLLLPACGTSPMSGAPVASLAVAPQVEAEATRHYYKLDEIKGIGPVYQGKLKAIGINGTQNMLTKLATRKDRLEIAEKTGISLKLLTSWANKADLMRIPGIGPDTSDLLEAVGVDTVPELAQRSYTNLHPRLEFANKISKKFINRVPDADYVRGWVVMANKMDRVIKY